MASIFKADQGSLGQICLIEESTIEKDVQILNPLISLLFQEFLREIP